MLAEGDVAFGVPSFNQLQRNQKLVTLYRSARALLHPDEPVPKLTAALESAVATVYEFAKELIEEEIDALDGPGETFWRGMVLEAVREQTAIDEFPEGTDFPEPMDLPERPDLPEPTDDDNETWTFLVERLADRVLWDNDYEMQVSLDLPPEESERLRATLGMTEDYYTDVPPDPRDEQIDLYVDALRGLTADAR